MHFSVQFSYRCEIRLETSYSFARVVTTSIYKVCYFPSQMDTKGDHSSTGDRIASVRDLNLFQNRVCCKTSRKTGSSARSTINLSLISDILVGTFLGRFLFWDANHGTNHPAIYATFPKCIWRKLVLDAPSKRVSTSSSVDARGRLARATMGA